MKRKIFIQFIFWFILIGINMEFTSFILPFPDLLIPVGITFAFSAIIFYSNLLFLFPRFNNSKNNLKYYSISTIVVIVMALIYAYVDYSFMATTDFDPPHRFKYPFLGTYVRSIFWLFLMQMISTIYMLQHYLKEQTEETKQIIEEKLNTELKYLKAQINPHFLFNALNNIYSLSYLKSDKAPEGVLKLSNMLRYVLEDCQADNVRLDSEIEYIQNFIDFQQMKSENKQNITFTHADIDPSIMVAPMLFISFIENSFKYSKIENNDNASVMIELKTDQKQIQIIIKNTIPNNGKSTSGSGKGIENVKQRLAILYPRKHELQITELKQNFTVTLKILRS